jgi:radical SAM superfamily enzyme YgiQ (UPF0313 family)
MDYKPSVTLYNPPSFYYTGVHYDCLPPLNLAIIAAMLKSAGASARVIDLEMQKTYPGQIAPPDSAVVGFTGLTIHDRGLRESIQALRTNGYTGRIVVGGIHATLHPEAVLAMGADLVITGESDGNVVELLLGDRLGIADGKRLPIDEIASPDWDACTPDIATYRGQYRVLHPTAGVAMWQRGCPYHCLFCGSVIYNQQKTCHRPPEQIADEMGDIHDRGIQNVYVYDDEMVGMKQPDGWMDEIADRIEGLEMNWITQGRCSQRHITPEVLNAMRRAGCKLISWGIESLSQKVLDALDKRIVIEDIKHSLTAAKKAGIKNNLFLQVGSYQETEEDLLKTESLLKELHRAGLVDYFQVFVTKIYPGAPLEEISKREGWYQVLDARALLDNTPIPTPWLSGEQILRWKSRLRYAVKAGAL